VQEAQGQAEAIRELFTVLLDDRRQDICAIDIDRPNPREVVQSGVAELNLRRVDTEPAGEQSLETDRDVAQPERSMTSVEQSSGHDADWVCEINDPCVGRAPLNFGSDVQHHGNCSQGLGKSACAGRFLSDATASKWNRLVLMPRRLTSDA
jgi:hypothetical protein